MEKNIFIKIILDYNGVLANKFIYGIGSNSVDVPTSITWIYTSLNKFASGFMNSPNLVVFDKETVKINYNEKYSFFYSERGNN